LFIFTEISPSFIFTKPPDPQVSDPYERYELDADTVLGGVVVTGYVRAAWAHYFRRDADLTASLIGQPGASFTATGAQADRNSVLVSVGAMARLSERVTLGLSLDSELSANSSRIGGSVQLRVSF